MTNRSGFNAAKANRAMLELLATVSLTATEIASSFGGLWNVQPSLLQNSSIYILHVGGGRRHPHLIVSCDRCRQKKLRCIMSQGQTTCTNCLRSSTECSFLDRQRFLTERESAILACMSQRNDITDLPRQDWITLESAAGTIGPPVNPGSDESPGDATLGDPSMAQHSPPTASRVNAESNMDPYSAIMTRFIEIFFRHHPHVFPFLDHSNTMNSYWNSSLPLQLANLIVLLALPYCSRGEVLNGVDLSASTTHCSEQAKIHISMHWDNPSLVMVKCLVLMAWYENSQGHTEVTGAYQRRAYEMAVALKLGDEAAIAGMSNNDQLVKVQLRALWNTVRAFA